jgi:hypothetical protein
MAAARRNQDFLSGSTMGAFLNPKAAVPLRNYQALNRAMQKQLEATCVAQRKAAEAAAAQPFRLPSQGKYQHVASRVFSASTTASANGSGAAAAAGSSSSSSEGGSGAGAGAGAGASAPGDSPLKENQRPFLRAGEKTARLAAPSPESPVKPFVRATGGERKAALPKFSELAAAAPPPVRLARAAAAAAAPCPLNPPALDTHPSPLSLAQASPPKNFLALNMALAPAPRPAPAAEVPISQRENYGKVPEYLEARKAQWAVEESAARRAREIREACPPGHRMMPEEERAETLALVTTSLEAAKKEVRVAGSGCSARAALLCSLAPPSRHTRPPSLVTPTLHTPASLPAQRHAAARGDPLCAQTKG